MTNNRYALAVVVFLPALAVVLFGAAASVAGQSDSTRVPHIILYDDGSWSYAPTATPTGTHTPTPTSTPTATLTPSATPTATATNTPDATPLPSATPGTVDPSPTPDTLPSVTPGPSATPFVPPESLCWAGTYYNLGIRTGPETTYAKVAYLTQGDRVVIDSLYVWETGANEWGHLADGRGWIALIYYDPPLTLAWLDDAAPCWELPRDGPGAVPAPPDIALGWHTVPGANTMQIMASFDVLESKGIPFSVKPYADMGLCVATLQRGGECIYRPGAPDCPSGVNVDDPRTNARTFMQHAAGAALVLSGVDGAWIEPVNECIGTPTDTRTLAWWSEWMDEYITQAAARGWPPLALPSLPPGHGDTLMFSVWSDVLQYLDAHGGLFSMHDYTFNSQTGLCVCDEWEACRHVHNYALMQTQGYTMEFAITEAARQSGNASVDESDFVCWFEQVRAHEFVHSVALWTGGYHPVWPNANLDGHYVSIADRVSAQ